MVWTKQPAHVDDDRDGVVKRTDTAEPLPFRTGKMWGQRHDRSRVQLSKAEYPIDAKCLVQAILILTHQ